MNIIKNLKDFQNLEINQKPYWYIPEEICYQITLVENNEPIVNLKQLLKDKKSNIIIANKKSVMIRKKVADLILKAETLLPNNLTFYITDLHRPLSLQKRLFNQIKKEIQKNNPTYTPKRLWQEVTKYIADPDGCPPHSTGGAIDITISDHKGNQIDMGCPIDTISAKSNTFYPRIKIHQKQNRKLLFDSLTKVGFVNLPTEWWHFSYGEQYWAAFKGKKSTIYSPL